MNITFLGLQIDNHINWKNHIYEINPKLSEACYAIRFILVILTLSNQFTIHTIQN
jgi:hypothetical protein